MQKAAHRRGCYEPWECKMQNAKFKMQNAKMKNAKCKIHNAKYVKFKI